MVGVNKNLKNSCKRANALGALELLKWMHLMSS